MRARRALRGHPNLWKAFWLSLSVVSLAGTAGGADARPFRGSTPIFVILCRTSDSGAAPRTVAQYRNLLFNGGTGGLADWWNDIGYQNFNNAGSSINGWYQLTQTTTQFNALDRWGKVNACLDAARTAPTGSVTVPATAIRYVVTSPGVDLFGWAGGAFLPFDFDVGAVAHEGGHGIGLDHTFSNDPSYRNADWAQIGEYDDPWDAMSWANSFRAPTPFGDAPSGLVTPHLDRLGWLPRTRIITHAASGASDVTYTLAATNHPEVAGALMVRVPFNPGDLFQYYTIEFRRHDRWSAGIPADTVLIHEVKRGKDGNGNPTGPQIAWLQRDLTRTDKAPAQTLNANGVQITVQSINAAGNQAVVRVVSQMAGRCIQGYVWREARPSDHVCVTGAERADTAAENALAASRVQPGGGPFGPDTCRQGFVWREAFSGDHVCVTGASRDRARNSNAANAERTNPARLVYGPNTCQQGYVWREADAFDWVCVTGAIRQQTRTENTLAATRVQPGGGPFGPDTCRMGFVWREAFPNDHVCVTGASRTQARNDNAAAPSRLVVP
jgi:hypothetical protein